MISELEGRITKFPVLPANRWDHFCGESKSAECAEDEDAAVLDVVEPKPADVKGQRRIFLLSYYLIGKAYDFYTQKDAHPCRLSASFNVQ